MLKFCSCLYNGEKTPWVRLQYTGSEIINVHKQKNKTNVTILNQKFLIGITMVYPFLGIINKNVTKTSLI